MRDVNNAVLKITGSNGFKRGPEPKKSRVSNGTPRKPDDATSAVPKELYRPLPPSAPKWANMGEYGRAMYRRIRKEQMDWHRGTDTRAFVGKPELEGVVAVCEMYDLAMIARDVLEATPDEERKPSLVAPVSAAMASWRRHHALLGYGFGCSTAWMIPTTEEDDDDDSDFG